MLSIVLLFALTNPDTKIWEAYLDIYRSIPQNMLILGPDEQFYAVNYKDCTIHIVDIQGNTKHVFAGKGEAPGKIAYPTAYEVYFMGDKLYFSTKLKTYIYESGGAYVGQVTAPSGSRLRKLNKGWISYDIEEGRTALPAAVTWHNEDLIY